MPNGIPPPPPGSTHEILFEFRGARSAVPLPTGRALGAESGLRRGTAPSRLCYRYSEATPSLGKKGTSESGIEFKIQGFGPIPVRGWNLGR